jgi:hypothetical protein
MESTATAAVETSATAAAMKAATPAAVRSATSAAVPAATMLRKCGIGRASQPDARHKRQRNFREGQCFHVSSLNQAPDETSGEGEIRPGAPAPHPRIQREYCRANANPAPPRQRITPAAPWGSGARASTSGSRRWWFSCATGGFQPSAVEFAGPDQCRLERVAMPCFQRVGSCSNRLSVD